MSYWDTAQMAGDTDLLQRTTACAATEGIVDPMGWADQHRWELAGEPGWADAWSSAVAAGNPRPGKDAGVITDGMILSGVQAVDGP